MELLALILPRQFPLKTEAIDMTRLPLLFALALTGLLGFTNLYADRPNVILMVTDDQGIGDFGIMGNDLIETPNIDAMAKGSGSLAPHPTRGPQAA